jgi:alkanesulfonate monooxygenase SsuD/methylene tetrahydromethanopterin reductase-like flavin-dependent oxidoreductase (luciferase family)
MKASIFCLPSVGSRDEIEAGMAATRPELYQQMLRELTELVKLADDLGYDSVSFTEHHFHIEGFELSNNPVLLDLYFAMQRSASASVSSASYSRPPTRSASPRTSLCSIT